jgi:hypothetical protein
LQAVNLAILRLRQRIQNERALMHRTSAVGMMVDFAYGRAIASSTARPGLDSHAAESIPGNSTATMLAMAAASKAWWESRRPQGWTLEQHLADPTAGCDGTAAERSLAEAVAHWIRQGG